MKILRTGLFILLSLALFLSCQKELEFETDGTSFGKLLKNAAGDCQPVTVNGTYKVDSVLTSNNYVDVQIDVTRKGTFDIKSDTVNGYSFSKTGSVTVGVNTVRLYGSGKPLAPGTNVFTIRYGNTVCSFSITLNVAPAVYTLGGAPGSCTGFILAGTFTAGVPLTSANTVTLNVNVISAGPYTISTATVNGITFSAAGVFTTTGPQTVVLTGSGTPAASGTFNIAVSGGGSCSFSCTCNSATPPANTDYVPETSFSNWSDRIVGGQPSDTSYVQVSPNTKVINGITYRIFEVKDSGNPVDSMFHHKNGGMYYQLYDSDYGFFDNPFNKDGLILDSSLAVNATWTINLGNNTVGGLPVSVKIDCQILAKNATAAVAGNNYSRIIKVKYSYIGNPGTGDILFAEEERWYARGFGLIYDKINDVPVTTTVEAETTRIQIF